jgi:hypothetical protein
MKTHYETTGFLTVPLVTMHTELDEIVPEWHEDLYIGKTGGPPLHTYWPPLFPGVYGHCNFTPDEVLGAFGFLKSQVTGQPVTLTMQ